MSEKRFIGSLKLVVVGSWLLLLTSCSTVLYQASGHYVDDKAKSREILMQWEAQKYYIPFVDANYGSVSLQAECMQDVFLDFRDNEEYGFIFIERVQDFGLATGAPDLRVDNFRVCVKSKGNRSMEEISNADDVELLVFCEPKVGDSFLPTNLDGYSLSIAQGESEETLECQPAE